MSMSKKDFVALADALRPYIVIDETTGSYEHSSLSTATLINVMVGFCREQNSRFDADRWLSYLRGECGPNGGKR